MNAPDVIDNIRQRMRALGLHKKGLSLASGNGATYISDLFVGKSKNPKTDQIQNVLRTLDRLEAEAAASKKGTALYGSVKRRSPWLFERDSICSEPGRN